jgi:hypothetical protein
LLRAGVVTSARATAVAEGFGNGYLNRGFAGASTGIEKIQKVRMDIELIES